MPSISSSTNDSLAPPLPSPLSSLPLHLFCFLTEPLSFIFFAYTILSTSVLLPPSVAILYRGVQQRKAMRSSSTSFVASHSDVFTFHLAIMELIGVFGNGVCCCSICRHDEILLQASFCVMSLTWFGEMYINLLTCLERHLAVVHPITYRRLRTEVGVRIRSGTIGCVWLLCVAGTGIVMTDCFVFVEFCFLMLSFTVVTFCSISVLRVLIRPGPGEQGDTRRRMDQSKQKSFITIMAIMVVLLVRISWNVVWAVSYMRSFNLNCPLTGYEIWFNLPGSAALLLLFLHRKGKLGCCRRNRK